MGIFRKLFGRKRKQKKGEHLGIILEFKGKNKMTKLENVKDVLKTIDYLKGATGEHYKNTIIAIICFEKNIRPNVKNWDTLDSIYEKWLDSYYALINDLFNDSDYALFDDKERKLLGL